MYLFIFISMHKINFHISFFERIVICIHLLFLSINFINSLSKESFSSCVNRFPFFLQNITL